MKITPLAQGTGVPAASDVNIGRSASPDRIAAAKAVAMGQDVPRETSGDAQVDRIQQRRTIKMKTQQSTNRHESPIEEVVEALAEVPKPLTDEPALETEDTRPLSPQVAAFMKQKRALQVKEREIAQREEALKTQTNSQAGNQDYISKADLIANPLKIFEAGITYDQLTEAILNGPSSSVDPVKLREDIKRELKEELLGEFTTRDQQTETQVLGEIKRETLALTAEGDDFEAIREEKAHDQVVKLVHKVYKEGWEDKGFPAGHILDTREAAQIVEDFLIDESFKKSQYKKVQSRLSPQVTEKIPVQKPGTKIMRTLTNRDTASPIMDKRARAIAAMQGTLKR